MNDQGNCVPVLGRDECSEALELLLEDGSTEYEYEYDWIMNSGQCSPVCN